MTSLEDWKRIISSELENAGFTEFIVNSKLDGENKVVVEVNYDGRTANGLPDLYISAIEDAKQHDIPLTQAFEARNMYANAI